MIRGVKYGMYAVLVDDVIVSGTLAYSREAAINHFLRPGHGTGEWAKYRKAGYRTESVGVSLSERPSNERVLTDRSSPNNPLKTNDA